MRGRGVNGVRDGRRTRAVTPDLFRGPSWGTINRVRERTPCVYILANGFYGTLYTGVTSNLIGRIMQHRAGAFDGYTKKHGIKRLMWYDVGDTMEAAIASEKRIKKWHRDWKINLIERQNREWNDLAVALGLDPLKT